MTHRAATMVPTTLNVGSVVFECGHTFPQLANLGPELFNFVTQFGDCPARVRRLRGSHGVSREERALALVTHGKAIALELPDRRPHHGDSGAVRCLHLRERRELAAICGELAGRDPPPEIIRHLLVGGLAGPLDHLHPKSLPSLCLIVPKRQR